MNRLNKLFETRKDLLSIYFTAGFPNLNDTLVILQSLQDSGVDFVEIGMPFSDPLADGPVIQASSTTALKNGMSLNLLFEQLQTVRQSISMPLVLMGYLNPVLRFGVEKFIHKCSEIGVDGVILPDLPFELFNREYRSMFESKSISNIFLITPQTSESRLRMLDEASTGFLYMVSSAAVTGAKSGISQSQIEYFERIDALNLSSPRMVGFGISDNDSFKQVCKYANGAIIGSAFIRMLEKSSDIPADTARFINTIKGGK